MKIEIVTKNIKDDSLVREYSERKVHFSLDRIGARVGRVVVRLQDDTKDSAAFSGHCSIEVEMKPKGHIHVSSDGESVFDCVLQAVRKMENAVKHEIDRTRQSSRIRHQQAKRATIETFPNEDEPLSTDSMEA